MAEESPKKQLAELQREFDALLERLVINNTITHIQKKIIERAREEVKDEVGGG